MQPTLSLNYHSRGGNGPMGLGWSISGTSSIHRCPQTPEQDGQSIGVSYTSTDQLCLDGQRLLLAPTSSFGYGAAGAEYRTEVDSYARIYQVGGDLTANAACFRVELKNGRILHYGGVISGTAPNLGCTITATKYSRVSPKAGKPLSWLVEKIEDRVGNNQFYTYTSNTFGENLLSTVSYTGSGTTAGSRTVTLNYGPRTTAAPGVQDVASSYLAGGETMQTLALTSIVTRVGSTTVRTYTPTYSVATYSKRLLMAQMTECAYNASGSACHPPTTFSYNDGALDYSPTSLNGINIALGGSVTDPTQLYGTPYGTSVIGDLDGDGTREVAVAATKSSGAADYLAQLTADGQVHAAVDLTGTPFSFSPEAYADIDGDGRAKLIQMPLSAAADQHLSFGVWKGARGSLATNSGTAAQNFAALFQNVASDIPYPYGQAKGFYTADMDGDGKLDVIVVKPDTSCGAGNGVFVYYNALGGPLTAGQTAHFNGSATPMFCLSVTTNLGVITTQGIDHIADFDGDGLPDFFITSNNTTNSTVTFAGIQFSQRNGTASLKTCSQLGLLDHSGFNDDECRWGNTVALWTDVNGDGLEDFVIANPLIGTWKVHLNQGGVLGALIDTGSSIGLQKTGTPAAPNSGGAFRYAGRLPLMDVDGDGKPDLLVPSETQGMHGFALKMCTVIKAPAYSSSDGTYCPATNPNAQQSALATAPQYCPAYSCPEDPGAATDSLPAGDGDPGYDYKWNHLPAFGTYDIRPQHGGAVMYDDSVYHLRMLKFQQTGANAIVVNAIETPLISRLNDSGQLPASNDDLYGTGLSSLVTTIGCANRKVTINTVAYDLCSVVGDGTYGPANLPAPDNSPTSQFGTGGATLYGNTNNGTTAGGSPSAAALAATNLKMAQSSACPTATRFINLPGLLNEVDNGLGDYARWGYAPLSLAMLSTQDCVYGYSIPSSNGYNDARHYYFASSLPIVTDMVQNNAAMDPIARDPSTTQYGFRSLFYGYTEAMYNHLGRGFQGFHTITTETLSSSTTRRLRTTTTFAQKFPLTGKVTSISTTASDTGYLVQTENDTWRCDRSNRLSGSCPGDQNAIAPTPGVIYQPYIDEQLVTNYEPGSGAASSQIDTLNAKSTSTSTSGWDDYSNATNCDVGSGVFGNLTDQVVTRQDLSVGGVFVASHKTTTANCYDVGSTNTTAWWVNRAVSNTTTNSIAYDAGHGLPSGAAAPDQILTVNTTWNSDRTPLTKTLQANIADQQSTTAYCYPQVNATTSPACPATTPSTDYGLPTQVTVTAPDLPAVLSPTRQTSLTYMTDGYFVATTKNALSQTTAMTTDPNDGQVLITTDPNGVQLKTTTDPFGRAIQLDHLDTTGAPIESAIQIATNGCPGQTCDNTLVGEDSNEPNVAYRVTRTQSGYPTQVSWMDLLDRPVKQAHAGFDGTFIAALTDYDELGTVLDHSTPYYLGNAAFFTGYTYDRLNRPLKKIADVSELGHGKLETLYTYAGRQTSITVHSQSIGLLSNNRCPTTPPISNECLQMKRSTDVLGQLMQTSESPGGVVQSTNYWTDAHGHVVAMQDAEGNVTTASYNALGQRTASNDPDQGSWTFHNDAFGELRDQTDARGVVTTVNQRDALGRMMQRQQVPPASIPTGLANETLLDAWSYDPAHGIGDIDTVTRWRNPNRTVPATTDTPVWTEQTAYEITTARPNKITTTIAEGTSPPAPLITQMHYDTNGRPDTRTYPSGLIVKNGYTDSGQLSSIINSATSFSYWTGTAANEWDHITSETLPGNLTGTHQDYHSTGQATTLSWASSAVSDAFAYGYDSFGNLTSQQRSAPSANNTETYSYDPLQRLIKGARNTGTPVNYAYTLSGNLKFKDDFSTNTGTNPGAYTYGTGNSNCGPHGVVSVILPNNGLATYSCDKNGNVIGGNTLNNAQYDADNHLRQITRQFLASGAGDKIFCNGYDSAINTCLNPGGSGYAVWAYTPNGLRDYESSNQQGARYYGPAGYEYVNGVHKHELGPVIVTRTGSNDTITVLLKDRLGSTLDAIDGTTLNRRHYDAFGKARNGDMSDRTNGTLNLIPDTIHGFTDHTHEDDVALIHMHGRVFDPNLGRFLSVDPVIQNPANSQALNPYSYIMNNPLSGTDPSGYQACTGSLVQRDSCESPTLSIEQVATPSKTQKQALKAIFEKMQKYGNGSASFSADGAGGKKDQQRMPSGETPDDKPGQPPTLSSVEVTDQGTFGPGWQASPPPPMAGIYFWLQGTVHGPAVRSGARSYAAWRGWAQGYPAADPVTGDTIAGTEAWDERVMSAMTMLAPVTVEASTPRFAALSAQDIISSTAQRMSNGGVDFLRGFLSGPERAAFARNPTAGSRFLGQAVHRATNESLFDQFLGRFSYRTQGPDFLDKATGEEIELTTPGQVGAHMARPGYGEMTYSTYTLPTQP